MMHVLCNGAAVFCIFRERFFPTPTFSLPEGVYLQKADV